ncbi:peptidylprolyl isomerase [Ornithinimicrobium sediminis]|uniref:peptidylprolyl isomerase n=1 Tax=Ornithinimicrobium sediminis TaxID=2904603 RepID=UPI001E2A5DEC|nr:peptidylprolyl isomerase [Ornithinimicrobium sediminis]MCE0487762.1 peptidylprolyl isomerase [Ornithinimicrobium sediminis]
MLPRRRALAPWYAAALVALAACGSEGEAVGDGAPGPDVAAGSAASPGPVVCSEAPPLSSGVPTFSSGEAPLGVDPGGPLSARLETTCGTITLELDGDAAPQTVASFRFLATEGYWENSPCHRVTTGGIFVLQCGDPTGTGRGTPGYTFGIENAPDDGLYPRGTVAMARAASPDSNGGQFFIVHQDTALPVEGGGYTIFGSVTDGMDIIDHVARAGVDGGGADGIPAQPISITEVEVEEEASTS